MGLNVTLSKEIYSDNITHNLNTMADEAGIYEHLWEPEEHGVCYAEELIEPLKGGLELLESDPERFKAFNPPNGYGSYEYLVEFVRGYLKACMMFPEARISIDK